MSWSERLFRLDGAVPREFTPRRLRTVRKLLLLGLVAAFPMSYFAYHLDRLQPVADHIINVLIETLVDEQHDGTSTSHDAKP